MMDTPFLKMPPAIPLMPRFRSGIRDPGLACLPTGDVRALQSSYGRIASILVLFFTSFDIDMNHNRWPEATKSASTLLDWDYSGSRS